MITHTSGGDPIPTGCEIGTFTVSDYEDTHTVTHDFGTVPRLAFVVDVLDETAYSDFTTPSNTAPLIAEVLGADPEDGTFDISKTSGQHVLNILWNLNMTDKKAFQQTNTYTTYVAQMTSTSVTFARGRYYNGRFLPGQTYLYVLIK